jgi:hypothetical protein
MIRACYAMPIALVVAWASSTVIFPRVDESRYVQSVTSFEDRPAPAMPAGPVMVAPPTHRVLSAGTEPRAHNFVVPEPRSAGGQMTRPLPRPPTPEQVLHGAPVPPPPDSLRNASDLFCIAVAIYHEARDQEDFGQRAVASVILQRALIPHRWGNRACDIVVPVQFSFMTSRYDYLPIDDLTSWEKAVQFAARALVEGPMPELEGADHYHTTEVFPMWAPEMEQVRIIDDHVFYSDPRSSL